MQIKRTNKKIVKRFILQIIFNGWFALSYLRNFGKANTILFYPRLPDKGSVIYKIVKILGCRMTNDARKEHQLAVHWEDVTVRNPSLVLNELNRTNPVININCRDISKTHVNDVFRQTFGYDLFIDPLTFKGRGLMKSETNGLHSGVETEFPIKEKEERFVYEKIIHCRYGEDLILNYRTIVMKDTIPFVYSTYRPAKDPFGKIIADSHITAAQDAYSADEVEKIISFCKAIGLDYGELDIIRDDDDGRIYILDCNNTPGGPTKLTVREMLKALLALSDEFEKIFLQPGAVIPAYSKMTGISPR